MTDEQFRMLLDLWMVSDPWPLDEAASLTFDRMLDDECQKRNIRDKVEAYHSFMKEDG